MSAAATIADLQLRTASAEDATFAAEVWTAIDPDEPTDPQIMRYRWENPPAEAFVERHIALLANDLVGIAGLQHQAWSKTPRRYAFLWADVLPRVRTKERVAQLLRFAESRARDEGTETLTTECRESDSFKDNVLRSMGYREDRRVRAWELDLVAGRDRLLTWAEQSRAKMRAAGIALRTLADHQAVEKYEQLWRCYTESLGDVPTTLPLVPPILADFMKALQRPGTLEDRIWIGVRDGEIVGTSNLQYPPVCGNVSTAWTGTKRSVRGQGAARALKLETIAQAIALGVPRIRTGNDSENAPILHINDTLGYRPIAGWIEYIKDR